MGCDVFNRMINQRIIIHWIIDELKREVGMSPSDVGVHVRMMDMMDATDRAELGLRSATEVKIHIPFTVRDKDGHPKQKHADVKLTKANFERLCHDYSGQGAIIYWIIDDFKREAEIDLRNDPRAVVRLMEAAEKAETELASATEAEIHPPFIAADRDGPKHVDMKLTRDKFDQLVGQPTVRAAKSSTTDQGKPTQLGSSREVDIVFVFDTTGSMSGKIQALLATCGDLITELDREQLHYRVGILAFGDLTVAGDTIKKTGMTRQLPVFREMLNRIPRNSGGANEGESSLEAIMAGIAMFRPPGQAVRVFVVITDEPALQSHRARQVTQTLRQEEILTFCITPNLSYFREMAKETGGIWLEVGADTSFDKIKAMLLALATKIAAIAAAVHNPELGGGSVKQYLSLMPGNSTKSRGS